MCCEGEGAALWAALNREAVFNSMEEREAENNRPPAERKYLAAPQTGFGSFVVNNNTNKSSRRIVISFLREGEFCCNLETLLHVIMYDTCSHVHFPTRGIGSSSLHCGFVIPLI